MPCTVPTLRVLLGLSLAAAGMAADDPAIERSVRAQEASQKTVASQTISTAKQIDALADDYACNQLGDTTQLVALHQISQELNRLSDPTVAGKSRNMPWVENRLTAARSSGDTRGELDKASAGQQEIIASMDTLLKEAQKQFGAMQQRQDLQDLIDKQQQLQDATQKLAEQTLGKQNAELTPEQKIEQERLAQQQQQLQDKVKEASKELQQSADSQKQQDPQTAQRLEDTAQQLDQQHLDKDMQQAADQLRENKMQDAQTQQQQVLDMLQKTQDAMQGLQPQDPQKETLAQLDQQLNKLDQLQQQQEQLLKTTEQMKSDAKPEEFNQLEAQQKDIAADMQDQKTDPAAQKHADKAADDLGKMEQKPATDEMKKALSDIDKEKKDLQDKIAKMQNDQKPTDQQTKAKDSKSNKLPDSVKMLENEGGKRNGNSWQVEMQPKEREILNTSAQEKFPHKYEQALGQYYHDLSSDTGTGN